MSNSRGTAPGPTTAGAEHLSLAWFARRSALWALIVAMGVGAACGLYAIAGDSTDAKANTPGKVRAQPDN